MTRGTVNCDTCLSVLTLRQEVFGNMRRLTKQIHKHFCLGTNIMLNFVNNYFRAQYQHCAVQGVQRLWHSSRYHDRTVFISWLGGSNLDMGLQVQRSRGARTTEVTSHKLEMFPPADQLIPFFIHVTQHPHRSPQTLRRVNIISYYENSTPALSLPPSSPPPSPPN